VARRSRSSSPTRRSRRGTVRVAGIRARRSPGASRPRCLCRLDLGDERDQRIYRPVAERDCAPLDRLHTTSPITVAKASRRRDRQERRPAQPCQWTNGI
jgi:hypothetical protein